MKNKLFIMMLLLPLTIIAACSDDENNENDEPKMLDVEFEPPEEVDVGETVEFEAIVTYGDEKVTDADQMEFEYWKSGDRDDGTFEDGKNNEDGTYTLEVTFEEDGVYEVYAHTTAETMHTMPKRYIAVGDVSEEELEEAKEAEEEDGGKPWDSDENEDNENNE